jgi:hypothetical protein
MSDVLNFKFMTFYHKLVNSRRYNILTTLTGGRYRSENAKNRVRSFKK